jgi:hypothetical protein
MIQLEITKTARGYSKKETFRIFDKQNKTFSDMQSARKWISDQYGKAKRSPMYIDGKDGKPQKIGYVIGFRNTDLSHYPVDKWIQRDWIAFKEIKRIIL